MTPPGQSIRLFRILGIDVFLHLSWFLVAVFEISSRTTAYTSFIWNVFEYVALFLIVLLHEFGHSLACRQVGGQVHQIMLWPLGGVASVTPPQRPGATLWTLAAGPLVNLALVPVLLLMSTMAGRLGSDPAAFLEALLFTNIVLLVFNLMPVYPLDGGQILRSLLWYALGRAKSLMAATIVGFVGIAGIVVLAAWSGSGWMLILCVYIALNCWNGFNAARALMQLESLPHHHDYQCPSCGAEPPRERLWLCAGCKRGFDPFETGAACPLCAQMTESVTCIECGAESMFAAWIRPPAAHSSVEMESELESMNLAAIMDPLYRARTWLRAVAVLTIISGVLMGLTIVGLVIAWIPIWAGIALFQSADRVEQARRNPQADTLSAAFSRLGTYFKVHALAFVIPVLLAPLLALAIYGVLRSIRADRPAQESAAIACLQAINEAEEKHLQRAHRYGTLAELGAQGFLDKKIVGQLERSYHVRVETHENTYIALASALSSNFGRYDYYSFADGVVRYSSDPERAPGGSAAAPVAASAN